MLSQLSKFHLRLPTNSTLKSQSIHTSFKKSHQTFAKSLQINVTSRNRPFQNRNYSLILPSFSENQKSRLNIFATKPHNRKFSSTEPNPNDLFTRGVSFEKHFFHFSNFELIWHKMQPVTWKNLLAALLFGSAVLAYYINEKTKKDQSKIYISLKFHQSYQISNDILKKFRSK